MDLELVLYPDPILQQKTKRIEIVDDFIKDLAESMLEFMKVEQGIGLAAPQVGHSIRLLVVGCEDAGIQPQALINPEIVSRSGSCVMNEGCLSFPGIFAPVRRAEKVTIKGQSLEGKEVTIEADDLYARVLQHEMDHLDGIIFIRYLSPAQRIKWRKVLKDLEARYKESNS